MQWKKNWEQFSLLMWMNLCRQKKQWKSVILVILYPVYTGSFSFILRLFVESEFVSDPTVYSSFTVSDLNSSLVPPADGNPWHLAYTPDTAIASRIVKRAVGMISMTTEAGLAFDTEDDLVEHLKTANNVLGGVVFIFNNNTNLPRNITYKIRLRAETYASTFGRYDVSKDLDWLTFSLDTMVPRPFSRQDNYKRGGERPDYYYEGFLTLQWAVDLSIIKEVNQNFDVNHFEIRLNKYPYPPYNRDGFLFFLNTAECPGLFMCVFFYPVLVLCNGILLEKDTKLKESMKLMGMKSWIYWCSLICKSAITVTISVAFVTAMLHVPTSNGAMINHTSWLITFMFLLLYLLSWVSFAFAVSTLFSTVNIGSALAFCIFCLSIMPYFFVDLNCSVTEKLAASLDFHLAFAFGFTQISQSEIIGVGVQFSNLAKPFRTDDSWTMLHVFGMLSVDILLYAIVAWYLDAVMPGGVGISQPCCFPFMRSYWFGHSNVYVAETIDDDNDKNSTSGLLSSDREEQKPMTDAKVGIKIRGLTKKFKSGNTVAVDNLNIDIYEGYITALVGQNEAGKTTTLSMLTGLLPLTDGNAYINGMNIKYEMERIRENLGFCPQHDILCDWLTVREYLIFFAKLKGCPSVEVDSKVSGMIEALHLEDKADVKATNLSAGLKRKLRVGIALIGDSKFVILDEPTSGMDPEERRQTWDFIQSQQKGRTIIFSTRCMDEADQLGDRIAIMAEGQIHSYGTPMFLKNKYGVGYHLTFLKKSDCNTDDLTAAIKSHIPEARLETNIGAEVTFVVPEDQSHKFEKLFARLEKHQKKLCFESFGVSVTTLEEAFFKVGQAAASSIDIKLQDSGEASVLDGGRDSAFGTEFQNEAANEVDRGILLVFVTRIVNSVLQWIISMSPFMVSIAIILFLLRNFIAFQEIKDRPPLYLDLSHFVNPITPFEVEQLSRYDREATKIAKCYAEVVGIGGGLINLNKESDYHSMSLFLLSIAASSMEKYNTKYLTGATIGTSLDGNTTITGWFNNADYHSISISLSQVSNTLMQCFGQKEYHIQTINHPLPWISKTQLNEDKRTALAKHWSIQFFLPFSVDYLLIYMFAIYTITVRLVGSLPLAGSIPLAGSKPDQLVSGARRFFSGFYTFLWDILLFLIPAAVTIVILECVHFSPYTEGSAMWFVLLDFIFYGFSIIPFVYIVFIVSQTAFFGISNILLCAAVVSTIVPIYMECFNLSNAAKILNWVFYITLPNFCFEKVFRDLISLYENHRSCSRIGDQFNQSINHLPAEMNDQTNQRCSATINYVAWEYPGIGRSLFFMALQSVIFFLILILIQSRAVSSILLKLKAGKQNEDVELASELADSRDSDVVCERDRILNTPITELSKTDLIVMQDLTKAFNGFIAVDNLSLGIARGECFGLLGVNGAGKSTCLAILNGYRTASSGIAFIGGKDVLGNGTLLVDEHVGYCQQPDACLDRLTVREALSFFASTRGICDESINQVVNAMIDCLMLRDYTNKLTKTLSGANKRKLTVALALIGEPQIILLDEPTAGMDPVTRRLVWNTLIAARRSGRTIMLTSNSMEECEALCSRIAIMVNGSFQCLGSIQHLKDKFTEGYSMIIKIGGTNNEEEGNEEKVNQIKSFVNSTFPGSIMKEHHEGLLHYQIKTPNLSWSQIFGTIERAKHRLDIEEYSVGQITLEQVFVSFALMQRARNAAECKS